MADQKINEVFSLSAIQAQFKTVFELMEEMGRRITALNKAVSGLNLSGGNRGAGTREAVKAANDLEAAEKRLAKAQSDLAVKIAALNAQTREQNKINKEIAAEVLGLTDAYGKLSKEYTEAARTAKNLAVTHGETSKVAQAAAKHANELGNRLKAIDATVGQYQRSVGNYASATFALSQILREAPAFAFNFQTGLLAISNNLPILFDEFNKLSAAIDNNTQKQVGAIGALKTMAASLLSWGNILTLVVSLVTIFGKEIGDWLAGLFNVNKKILELADSQKQFNEALKEGAKDAQQDIVSLDALYRSTQNVSLSMRERKKAVDELQKQYPAYFKNIKDEDFLAGKAADAYVRLKDAILAAAQSRAIEGKLVENSNKILDLDEKRVELINKRNEASNKLNKSRERSVALDQAAAATGGTGSILAAQSVNRLSNEYDKFNGELEDTLKQIQALEKANSDLVDRQNDLIKKGGVNVLTGVDGKEEIKTEEDKQKKLLELRLRAALESRNIDIESAIEAQKAIAENERINFGERLEALAQYNVLRNIQAKDNADTEKKILEQKVKDQEAVEQEILNVDKQLTQERLQISRDTAAIQSEIVKQNVDARIAEILRSSEIEKQELQRREDEEVEAVRKLYENTNISIEQFEAAQLQIKNKYAVLTLQDEIETTKKILEIRRARGEDVSALEKTIFDANRKLLDLDFEVFKNNEDRKRKESEKTTAQRKREAEELRDKLGELAQETVNAIFEISKGQFQTEKNRIADEIDLVNKRKKEEIDAINATTLSAQEKADRIIAIEARAQTQQEQLEARRRQIDIERARFERAQAISGIILNTSLAVVKALPNVPLAVAIGAIGAVQLATALATPLPRYFMGREDGPAEWALVNDGGRKEVIQKPDGSAYIPKGFNVPVFLGKGDKVHSSVDEYVESVGDKLHRRAPSMEVTREGQLRLKYDLEKQTAMLTNAMAKNKSVMVVNNTWAGVMISEEVASGFIDYIHKNVRK